jgi:hypothetical protein
MHSAADSWGQILEGSLFLLYSITAIKLLFYKNSRTFFTFYKTKSPPYFVFCKYDCIHKPAVGEKLDPLQRKHRKISSAFALMRR